MNLYKHLFPVIIRLATDVDQVTRQLFSTLVFQLIHWFTQNIEHENKEVTALLDAATDAAGSATNGALREFGAQCLAEILQWSMKQQKSSSNGASQDVNLSALTRRLFGMLLHPNPFKRLGGCMALNSMYRKFREVPQTVSIFALEILNNVLSCLAMAENDDASLGTSVEAQKVLDHFKRIVIGEERKHYRLLVKNSKARLGPEHCQNLGKFVRFLFENLGRPEDLSRRYCWSLFTAFAPFVTPNKVTTISDWIATYIGDKSVGEIVNVLETGGEEACLRLAHPAWIAQTASDPRLQYSVSMFHDLLDWIRCLATSMDGYFLFFDQDCGVLPQDLFSADSVLIDELSFFLTHTMTAKNSLLKMEEILSGDEKDMLKQVKCTATIRLFRLIKLLSEKHSNFTGFNRLFDADFYSLVFQSLLDPEALGLSVADRSRIRDLQETVGGVCKVLVEKGTTQNKNLFKKPLKTWLGHAKLGQYFLSSLIFIIIIIASFSPLPL